VKSADKSIILTTINAKWIHPSLALRLLKANLGSLEENCEIIEFALRQPLGEKVEPLLAARPRILGISVSIWNHTATVELLEELEKAWAAQGAKLSCSARPVVVLGGPEVTHLPPSSEIFRFADYVIRGDGEEAFRSLCENILTGTGRETPKFINAAQVNLEKIKSGYHLYTDEDLTKKLIYVEASRGCPFNCEFCLSAIKDETDKQNAVREFPLESFLAQMDALVRLGVKTFKFLDRTFNLNIDRAIRIIDFFLEKIEERKALRQSGLVVHFEMVPSLFPDELREALTRFPPETLRLEIGIQTLNAEVSARIGRPSNPEKELETLRFLREKTSAIIHADLIAGLPGEDLSSFGRGFDRLWQALCGTVPAGEDKPPAESRPRAEIQLGILKLLPGAPVSRHSEAFSMRYNPLPPYEIEETASVSAGDFRRLKNFARFWELIVNRGLANFAGNERIFDKFMTFSDTLYAHFDRNWGIDKTELRKSLQIFK
jgi:radical SAM superfamily enzyme YgiQ (UPF0313 family)